MMLNSYSGKYKNFHLRSSYEYAVALFLDHQKKRWIYEGNSYIINNSRYIPDFTIFNKKTNKIKYIIEVKSTVPSELKKARLYKKELDKMGIKLKIYTYKKILKLYKKFMDISLNFTINEWKKLNINNRKNFHCRGKGNPNFGNKLCNKSKRLISLSSKDRWQNSRLKKLMIAGSKKGALAVSIKYKGIRKKEWVSLKCIQCGSIFEVEPRFKNKRKFCKLECANLYNSFLGGKIYSENIKKIHIKIKKLVIKWIRLNGYILEYIKLNSIKNELESLRSEVEERYKIKDLRFIAKACGIESLKMKDFLMYLKDIYHSN